MNKKKVLVVDDSALIRQILTQIINDTEDLEVIGTAPDPFIARDKIKRLNPDVITLDVEMPKMDGITFLKNLMRLRPMPVVMISTLTQQGADTTLKALELGAVDFVAKPTTDVSNQLGDYAEEIIEKIRTAAVASVSAIENGVRQNEAADKNVNRPSETKAVSGGKPLVPGERLIALGASTGGTEAIKVVVSGLPVSTPPIVVSQHLPAAFSESFAYHVNEVTEMTAVIPKEGEPLLHGHIYIAPGDHHLQVVRQGNGYVCHLEDGPVVNRHKPAVDVMYRSVTETFGKNAVGVLLTGMGVDGAKGLLEMKEAGSPVIIQDQESSVVWGMPGEAWKIGCRDYVMPLKEVAKTILSVI